MLAVYHYRYPLAQFDVDSLLDFGFMTNRSNMWCNLCLGYIWLLGVASKKSLLPFVNHEDEQSVLRIIVELFQVKNFFLEKCITNWYHGYGKRILLSQATQLIIRGTWLHRGRNLKIFLKKISAEVEENTFKIILSKLQEWVAHALTNVVWCWLICCDVCLLLSIVFY